MINWNLVWQFVGTIFIPSLYLINIFIAFNNSYSFKPAFPLVFLGVIIGFLGLILWVISYINLGKSFGVLPQKQKRVKRGIYKYFNHPMYIAIWLTFLGISLANASWESLVFLNVVITPLLFIRAYFEEKKLVN